MAAEVEHYVVMGLPSGEEGAKLSEEDIKKAFRSKVKEVHADKRPDAHQNFLNLKASFTILMDKKARHIFHQQAAKKNRCRNSHEQNFNSKRRRKKTDVDEREQLVALARRVDPLIARIKCDIAARAARSAARAARVREESIRRRIDQLIARKQARRHLPAEKKCG